MGNATNALPLLEPGIMPYKYSSSTTTRFAVSILTYTRKLLESLLPPLSMWVHLCMALLLCG